MNEVILMGRLTKDPDLRYTNGNNTPVASYTIAVNRRMAKEGQPNADFINCVTWSKGAEFVNKYFKKGQQISLVGRLQTRTWDDDEGKRHYVTEVVTEKVYFAGSRPKSAATNRSDADDSNDSHSDGFYPQDGEEDDELPF